MLHVQNRRNKFYTDFYLLYQHLHLYVYRLRVIILVNVVTRHYLRNNEDIRLYPQTIQII